MTAPLTTAPLSRRVTRRIAIAGLAALLLTSAAGAHPSPTVALAHVEADGGTDPAARLRAAALHLELGELDAARADLAAAAAALPDDHPGLARVAGRLALAAGDDEAALAHWRRGAGRPSPLQAALDAERAALLARLGRWDEARRAWAAAVRHAPRAGAELYLGWATAILGGDAAAAADPARVRAALDVVGAGRRALGEVPALVARDRELTAALGRPPTPPTPPTPKSAARSSTATPIPTAAPPPAKTATVVRGPYLQQVTRDSAIVRWRTDVASVGRLWWGASPDALDHGTTEGAAATDYELTIGGLAPGETAYYAVGTDDGGGLVLAGGDADHRVRAAPSPGSQAPRRLWVIGDSGTANADARAVRDAYLAFPGAADTGLWLMLGDNAYGTGTEDEYQAAVFATYPTLLRRSPVWPAIGNHDALSADSPTQSGPFFDLFTLPTGGEAGGLASGSEAYYAFDWGDLHLVCLDSADSSLAVGSAMLDWLTADLAASDARWTIVFFHHPPYSKGSHDSDDPADSGGRLTAVRENVLPILEAAGVHLVLSGHSHAYERSHLLRGHFGTSDTLTGDMLVDAGDGDPAGDGPYRPEVTGPGTIYNVTGSSGRLGPGTFDHPVMVTSLPELGSLVLDVAGPRLEGRFLDSLGTVRDHFLLIAEDAIFRDGFESADTAAWSVTVSDPS